jgi:hypothetical protein
MKLFKPLRKLLCLIGLHKVVEYQGKFREGEFYCANCHKDIDYPY